MEIGDWRLRIEKIEIYRWIYSRSSGYLSILKLMLMIEDVK